LTLRLEAGEAGLLLLVRQLQLPVAVGGATHPGDPLLQVPGLHDESLPLLVEKLVARLDARELGGCQPDRYVRLVLGGRPADRIDDDADDSAEQDVAEGYLL
jgi:hypothetical protein